MPEIAVLCAALILVSAPVLAADPVGLWRTQADQKGQVADVRAAPCGGYVCGTIVAVFDDQGQPVPAQTIGVKVFWNMAPDGADYVGRAYVPAHRREYQGRLRVQGNQMTVSGCLGPICQSQVWTRLK